MADYPFNLHGAKAQSSGGGQEDGDTFKSREFELKPGIVCAEIKHHGSGDFKLEFVPTEGVSRGVARVSGTVVSGAATGAGAAIGSIVPFAGTIIGAAVGGAAGRFVGEKVGGVISGAMSSSWTPVDGKGQCNILDAVRVRENDGDARSPGKYRLEVKSQSEWSCRFIQPDLAQSDGPLTGDEDAIDDRNSIPAGAHVLGPYKSGARPLLANFRHNGGGGFFFKALAVDGMHEYTYSGDGQFIVKGIQTDIRPGKEYLLIVSSDGEWNFAFTEGY